MPPLLAEDVVDGAEEEEDAEEEEEAVLLVDAIPSAAATVLAGFVFFLLFNNFIPISLYVTLELVNVGQSSLIAADSKMYDETLDVPATVRSSNLVQELGQVSNVFSDKTGTLTRNEMRFINGRSLRRTLKLSG